MQTKSYDYIIIPASICRGRQSTMAVILTILLAFHSCVSLSVCPAVTMAIVDKKIQMKLAATPVIRTGVVT